jgi:hypothetical protein
MHTLQVHVAEKLVRKQQGSQVGVANQGARVRGVTANTSRANRQFSAINSGDMTIMRFTASCPHLPPLQSVPCAMQTVNNQDGNLKSLM